MCSLNTQLVRWFDVKAKVDLMFCPPSPALYIRNKIPSLINHNFTRKKNDRIHKKIKKTMDTLANFFSSADLCMIWHPHWRILHCLQHVIHTANVCENYWTVKNKRAHTSHSAVQCEYINGEMSLLPKPEAREERKKNYRENYTHLTIDRTKT